MTSIISQVLKSNVAFKSFKHGVWKRSEDKRFLFDMASGIRPYHSWRLISKLKNRFEVPHGTMQHRQQRRFARPLTC